MKASVCRNTGREGSYITSTDAVIRASCRAWNAIAQVGDHRKGVETFIGEG